MKTLIIIICGFAFIGCSDKSGFAVFEQDDMKTIVNTLKTKDGGTLYIATSSYNPSEERKDAHLKAHMELMRPFVYITRDFLLETVYENCPETIADIKEIAAIDAVNIFFISGANNGRTSLDSEVSSDNCILVEEFEDWLALRGEADTGDYILSRVM